MVKPKNRLDLVRLSFFLCFGILFLRLATLQIKDAPELKRRARAEHFKTILVPAPRGTIYDRNGKLLAISVKYYALYAEPKYLKEPPASVAERLAPILDESPVHLTAVLSSDKGFVWLKRRLNYDDYVTVRDLKIEGIGFQETYCRFYPEGEFTSHIVGVVDIDGKGLEGIEKEYNHLLVGKDGKTNILRDGIGRSIPSYNKGDAPRPGQDVYLTIDLAVQRVLEEEIERVFEAYSPRGVVGIVLDANNGEILALANRPTYDPNQPNLYPVDFRRNRAITDLFEPGSVFKIITAAAGLEENLIKPEGTIFCEAGKFFVRGHVLHDAHPYGTISFREVIVKSSNIGTVKVGLRLGEKRMYKYAEAFGFGKETGIDLPGEISGILRPLAKWSGYSITAIPIGQEVGATALQCSVALAAVVNGGRYYQPYFLLYPQTQKPPARQVISEKTTETLSEILSEVTTEEGTARWADIPGYFVGGKTGTGQKVVGGYYSHHKFFASFAGFIKTTHRNLIIFVMADEPKGAYYGGVVAGPAFNRIGQRTLLVLDIPPDREIVTELQQNGFVDTGQNGDEKNER